MQYYKNIFTKKNLLCFTGVGWCVLGFNRGLYEYEYDHKHNHKNYFYTDKIFNGLMGLFLYVNPGLLPFAIYKEIYRLEINLRGLEEEKKTEYYNKILL